MHNEGAVMYYRYSAPIAPMQTATGKDGTCHTAKTQVRKADVKKGISETKEKGSITTKESKREKPPKFRTKKRLHTVKFL